MARRVVVEDMVLNATGQTLFGQFNLNDFATENTQRSRPFGV